ncbi:O-antigen ligase family protein [Microbacterium aurum]
MLALLVLAARWARADLPGERDVLRDNIPLLLFGAFSALALTAAILRPTPETWSGDGYRHESIFTYLSYVGFFFLASQVFSSRRRRFVVGLVLGLVLVSCVVTLVSVTVNAAPTENTSQLRHVKAYFEQFNHYGYLLAVGAALAAAGTLVARSRLARSGSLAIFAITLLTLLFNDTLGASVALAVGVLGLVVWLATMGRLRARRTAALVAVAISVHLVAEFAGAGILNALISLGADVGKLSAGGEDAGSAGTGRWELWVATIERIAADPWLGHGVEGIAAGLPGTTGRSHNEYLQYAAFFGVPALLAYLGAIGAITVRVVRRGRAVDDVTVCAAIGAATYLVSACFGNTMYYTAPVLFLLLGIVWSGVRLRGEAPARSDKQRASQVSHWSQETQDSQKTQTAR